MKVYVVAQIGWEYNDEYWYQPESEGVTPLKAYKKKEKAEEECVLMNAQENQKIRRDDYYVDSDGNPITEHYKVVEIEMDPK